MIPVPDAELLALRVRLAAAEFPADDLTDLEVARVVVVRALAARLRRCPTALADRHEIAILGHVGVDLDRLRQHEEIAHRLCHKYRRELTGLWGLDADRGDLWPAWVPLPPDFPTGGVSIEWSRELGAMHSSGPVWLPPIPDD